jgi:glycosyltransferase involved in cell wall biosynthesis
VRILLAANASYVPPRGGATRSNLIWLEALARRGHACRVLAAALDGDAAGRAEQMRDEQIQPPSPCADGLQELTSHAGVSIYTVLDSGRRGLALREHIREFEPDWVLVSSEDVGQILLREAHASAPGRVVYLAHTPQFFPFGPESWNPDESGAELVRRCAGVVAIGRHMAGYIERHCGTAATVIHPPIYGSGPFTALGRFGEGLITMVNPCAVKGIAIFAELARRFPGLEFGAVPGWGTTSADRRMLEQLPNVRLLANARRFEDLLAGTRILLMPSLWYEGFGLTVMQAMLHGIPAAASDSGGLKEAKAGVGCVVPVRPIEHYESGFDERGMPRAVIPEQPMEVWEESIATLTTSREAYEAESALSRAAALRFVESVNPDALEQFLVGLHPAGAGGAKRPQPPLADALASLSPEKRALVAQLLRKRGSPRG